MEFRVWDARFGVWDSRFRDWDSRFSGIQVGLHRTYMCPPEVLLLVSVTTTSNGMRYGWYAVQATL